MIGNNRTVFKKKHRTVKKIRIHYERKEGIRDTMPEKRRQLRGNL